MWKRMWHRLGGWTTLTIGTDRDWTVRVKVLGSSPGGWELRGVVGRVLADRVLGPDAVTVQATGLIFGCLVASALLEEAAWESPLRWLVIAAAMLSVVSGFVMAAMRPKPGRWEWQPPHREASVCWRPAASYREAGRGVLQFDGGEREASDVDAIVLMEPWAASGPDDREVWRLCARAGAAAVDLLPPYIGDPEILRSAAKELAAKLGAPFRIERSESMEAAEELVPVVGFRMK